MTFLKGQNYKDNKKIEASQVALVVKNPPTNEGDKRYRVQSLGQEDLLKEEMANHSSILESLGQRKWFPVKGNKQAEHKGFWG